MYPDQKITPCLWFDGNAEEAVAFYGAIFPDMEILNTSHYGEGAPFPKGTVLTQTFRLAGQTFMALNGGPQFKFTEALSLLVSCDSQAEVDWYWDKLCEGGEPGPCGWLKDKYGLSWQIIPKALGELLGGPDPARNQRVMEALLQMSKLDIAALEAAGAGV